MILKVHADRTDTLNLIDIGNEFVKGSDHREKNFGKFLETDVASLNNIVLISLFISLLYIIIILIGLFFLLGFGTLLCRLSSVLCTWA